MSVTSGARALGALFAVSFAYTAFYELMSTTMADLAAAGGADGTATWSLMMVAWRAFPVMFMLGLVLYFFSNMSKREVY